MPDDAPQIPDKRSDRIVLEAAKKWRYKPATWNGKPIKFRKFVQITLAP